jgi:hypothetical protein
MGERQSGMVDVGRSSSPSQLAADRESGGAAALHARKLRRDMQPLASREEIDARSIMLSPRRERASL